MALWNNTDREESKPTWLNAAQKINCVRTVRGWELALDGTSLGGQLAGLDGYTGVTAFTPHMELLVCLPLDPSPAGVTDSNYADRATVTGGTASTNDLPNYAPYFSCPFDGDSATAGGFDGNGLSSAATQAAGAGAGVYALNKYGVSSLHYPGGITAYIKVVANDTNLTNTLGFAYDSDFGANGVLYDGTALLNTANVPVEVYEAFFGPTTDYINNIGVFRIAKAGATSNSGPYDVEFDVDDATVTSTINFSVSFGATFA
jgi:hypothetical protein